MISGDHMIGQDEFICKARLECIISQATRYEDQI